MSRVEFIALGLLGGWYKPGSEVIRRDGQTGSTIPLKAFLCLMMQGFPSMPYPLEGPQHLLLLPPWGSSLYWQPFGGWVGGTHSNLSRWSEVFIPEPYGNMCLYYQKLRSWCRKIHSRQISLILVFTFRVSCFSSLCNVDLLWKYSVIVGQNMAL